MSASVFRCCGIKARALCHGRLQCLVLQVWITGHSLGGGYANAVVLHMLANRSCAELFAAGALSRTLPHLSVQLKPYMYPWAWPLYRFKPCACLNVLPNSYWILILDTNLDGESRHDAQKNCG